MACAHLINRWHALTCARQSALAVALWQRRGSQLGEPLVGHRGDIGATAELNALQLLLATGAGPRMHCLHTRVKHGANALEKCQDFHLHEPFLLSHK